MAQGNQVVAMPPQLRDDLIAFGHVATELRELTAMVNNLRYETFEQESRLKFVHHTGLSRFRAQKKLGDMKYQLNKLSEMKDLLLQYRNRACDYMINAVAQSPMAERPYAIVCRNFRDVDAVSILKDYFVNWDDFDNAAVMIGVEDVEVIVMIHYYDEPPRVLPRLLSRYAQARGFRVQFLPRIWV